MVGDLAERAGVVQRGLALELGLVFFFGVRSFAILLAAQTAVSAILAVVTVIVLPLARGEARDRETGEQRKCGVADSVANATPRRVLRTSPSTSASRA
jgi:hypothetical protein